MSGDETKQKIMKAALKIIANEDVQKLTIRRIAEQTGVNVAAINYHFRSKENLILEAMKMFGNGMRDMFDILKNPEQSDLENLTQFLDLFLMKMMKFPGFMRNQIQLITEGKAMHVKAVENMKFGRKNLIKILGRITGESSEKTLSMKLFQMMSVLILPVFFGDHVQKIYEFNINDGQERAEFLRILTANLKTE